MDATLLGLIKTRFAELERTHLREHELAEAASRELLEERKRRIDGSFLALREWVEVRFAAIEKLSREHRTDDQRALEAAFASAKEAIAADRAATQEAIKKSETAQQETNKATYVAQEQLGAQLQNVRMEMASKGETATQFLNNDRRITALERKVDRQEAAKLEATESRTTHQVNTGQIIAAIVGLAVVIGVILAALR